MKGMKGNQFFYVGLKAFIEKDGAVLVMEDPAIGIDFPGGKIKEEEWDLAAVLMREVDEETGLTIEVGAPFCAWRVKFPPHPVYTTNDVFLVGYRCRYVSGEVRLSAEHKSFEWVTKDTYRKRASDTPHFKALEKYFANR